MEKKPRIPYIGVRKYKHFTVEYSMKRLKFSFEYAQDKIITWTTDRVTEYPNFQKMTKHDLWVHYTYVVLPQVRQYFNLMSWYNMS